MSNTGRSVALYYATHDGHSRRIAEHISRRLAESGIVAAPLDLAAIPPSAADLSAASAVALLAAVRYGRHLPEVDRFLTAYRSLSSPPPLAFASVNLTARKPGKTTASGNPYVRKLFARHRVTPALAVAFAGRLDYRRYGWRDRHIIRFIMLLTGGPTDPATSIDYTSWPAVDEFAAGVAALYRRTLPIAGSPSSKTAAAGAFTA